MKLEFEDESLALALTDDRASELKLSVALIKSLRRKLQLILAANDERDLRQLKSLHFEKLKGDRAGQRSIRLNDQYRLIVRLDDRTKPPTIVAIGIEDYH